MIEYAEPLVLRTWDEVRAMSPEARSSAHCGSGDLVAHVTVGPAAEGKHLECVMMDREHLVRVLRAEIDGKSLAGTPADQKLSRSALDFMRDAPLDAARQAVMPTRTEDALWLVLADGANVVGIVSLSYPVRMARGGDA